MNGILQIKPVQSKKNVSKPKATAVAEVNIHKHTSTLLTELNVHNIFKFYIKTARDSVDDQLIVKWNQVGLEENEQFKGPDKEY